LQQWRNKGLGLIGRTNFSGTLLKIKTDRIETTADPKETNIERNYWSIYFELIRQQVNNSCVMLLGIKLDNSHFYI
jgi:hypothetical protein